MRKFNLINIIFFIQLLSFYNVYAQSSIIKGKVSDENGGPLIGANVTQKGTTNGTFVNTDGSFSINITQGQKLLVVSFIGYLPQEVSFEGKSTLNIVLKEDSKALDEVVVVGYNTTSRKNILGSIASIKDKDLEQITPVNAFDAVQGRLAGVQITSNGGPGSGSDIRIRGTSTLSGGVNPLYVVDGQQLEDIDNLNPADIASIEILKDGASAAIYGSKSANGVVIITTKSGKAGELKFDVDYSRVYSSLASSIPTSNTRQRVTYENIRSNANPDQRNADSTSLLYQNSPDLQKEVTRIGIRDQINLSLSGGAAKNRFYWNTGYLQDEGIVLNSSYQRISSKFKLDLEISKRLSGSTTTNLSFEFTKGLNENTVFQQIAERIAYFPIREPNGDYTPEIAGRQNSLAEALFTKRDDRNFRVQNFNFLEFEIIPDLSFKTTLGVNFRLRKENNFDPTIVQTVGRPATGSEYYTLSHDILQENYLKYRKKIGSHTFGALAGMSSQIWNEESSSLQAISFLSDNIETFNNVSELNLGATNTDKFIHSLTGLFGDLSYNYKEKYLVKGTVRRDGSSRFGSNRRYGTFPSGSIGWRISGEEFMKNVPQVENLLLRYSFGTTGNERIGNYESLLLYRPGSYYNAVNGVAPYQLANPNLGWESTNSQNLGLDLAMFKGRFSLGIDLWEKVTKDLLYTVPIPEETGYSGARQNIGSVQNRGIDINVGGTPFKRGKFEWYSNFNITFLENKVTELADADGFQTGNYYVATGQPIGNIFGYKNLGIFPYNESNAFDDSGNQLTPQFDDAGKFSSYMLNGSPYSGTVNKKRIGSTILKGGDINWQDLDGNFAIDGFDRLVLGNGLAKYFGGFFNEFKYKEFSLSTLFDYSFGQNIFRNYDQQRNDLNSSNETPAPERIENSWRKQGDIAEYASLDRNRTQNRLGPNSQYVTKGDYIKWRNARLSYRMPNVLVNKLKFAKSISANFSINNILTLTNYAGYNPELGTRGNPLQPGQDNLRYPNKRDFIIGLKLGF